VRRLAAALATSAALGAAGHGAAIEADAPFAPPQAGSYGLAVIQAAPGGEVLDLQGRTRPLRELTHGRITLLGFVYTRCAEPEGCPRATWALSAVRNRVRNDHELRSRVRFVSLSFDPAHDTPPVLAAYAAQVGGLGPGPEWRFVTAASKRALQPILEGFGQDLSVAADSTAVAGTEEFSHTLKAFLIDARGQVREIYSSAYLMPAMIVNDMRTLAREGRLTRTR